MTADPVHVLVVKDERDELDMLDGHLRRLGCRVTRAESGEQALEKARADPPTIAIVDVTLPGIDGREVARQLRADPRTRDCQIIVSSVLDPQDIEEIAIEAVLAQPSHRTASTG